MKKLYSLLFLFFICFSSGYAQISDTLVLAAYAHSIYNGITYIPTDSGELHYAPGYSYNNKTGAYQYDTTFIYNYNPATGYPLTANAIRVATYDSHKNLVYDIIFKKDNLGLWLDSQKYTYNYDGNDVLLSSAFQIYNPAKGIWDNKERHTYTNDIKGNRLTDIRQLWDTAWSFFNEHCYTYDSAGRMLSDTTKHWLDRYKILVDTGIHAYYYDTPNVFQGWTYTSAVFDPLTITYTYKFVFKYLYLYDAWTKDLVEKDHIVHDPVHGTAFFTDTAIYYTTNSAHDIIEEENPHYYDNTFTYDTDHNMTFEETFNWNYGLVYLYSYHYIYSYNSNHQVTVHTQMIYDVPVSKWKPQFQNRYYYKKPPPPPKPNAINTTSMLAESLRLYPTPANSVLNIDIKTDREEPLTVAIYDLQGRLYSQWLIDNAMFSHSSMPVSQLPAGNYILTVKSNTEKVSRLFTVAH